MSGGNRYSDPILLLPSEIVPMTIDQKERAMAELARLILEYVRPSPRRAALVKPARAYRKPRQNRQS